MKLSADSRRKNHPSEFIDLKRFIEIYEQSEEGEKRLLLEELESGNLMNDRPVTHQKTKI